MSYGASSGAVTLWCGLGALAVAWATGGWAAVLGLLGIFVGLVILSLFLADILSGH